MDITLKRILELIGSKHGSSQELVRAIDATKNAVTEWKSGRSKSYRQYLPQIAAYYGVSLDWLTGLSDIKNPPAVSDEGKLNEELVNLLCQLNPEELKLVDSYVRLILSAHKE